MEKGMKKGVCGLFGVILGLTACATSDNKYEKFPVHKLGENQFKVVVDSQWLAKAKNVSYQVADFHCKKSGKERVIAAEEVSTTRVYDTANYVVDLYFSCN